MPQKCRNKLKPKGMVHVINPPNYNLNQFNTENVDARNATNQPQSTVELGYMCIRGLTGPPAVTLTK